MTYLPAELIKKKRNGHALTQGEIEFFIGNYVSDQIPDYQVSAWLMAVFFKGMSHGETAALTQALLDSGDSMDWPKEIGPAVDKHSTGGVGDKTSLILAPIVAAAGVPVPMISGRGLGHTGGTLDKLESIPGFRINLSTDEFRRGVVEQKLSFIGQTAQMCPADKKLYALRDVTGTVESLPLICSSILSKKISEGISGLVLDVKFGSGAFMKSIDQATALADLLTQVASAHGKEVATLITSMDQPLGRFSGNALEVIECLEIMEGKTHRSECDRDLYEDTRHLSLELAALMIWLGKKAKDLDEARRTAEDLLTSGKAMAKFAEVCRVQGGDLSKIPLPSPKLEIKATGSGFIQSIDTEKVGLANIHLGAGRRKTSDPVNPSAGIECCLKIGDEVKEGQTVFRLYGDSSTELEAAKSELEQAVNYSLQKVSPPDLIKAQRLP